jgi:hypothetical protein
MKHEKISPSYFILGSIINFNVEFIIGIDFNFRHWLVLAFIKRRHLRFWRAEFAQMLSRGDETPVIRIRLAVTPREAICFGCRFNCRRAVARISFNLREDVEGIRVKERIRTAFRVFPHIIQQFTRRFQISLPSPQFCERNECREFFNEIYCSRGSA